MRDCIEVYVSVCMVVGVGEYTENNISFHTNSKISETTIFYCVTINTRPCCTEIELSSNTMLRAYVRGAVSVRVQGHTIIR